MINVMDFIIVENWQVIASQMIYYFSTQFFTLHNGR